MTKLECNDINPKVYVTVTCRIRSHSRTAQTIGGNGLVLTNLINLMVDYKA
jgi:hypothetical protein